jgi:hypothetical protein
MNALNLFKRMIGKEKTMAIFCKVDGNKFEPKESHIYCSLDCALKDCAEIKASGCLIINHKIIWGKRSLESSNNASRRVLQGIQRHPLAKNEWLLQLTKDCAPYCLNLDHFKVVNRTEFLAKNARERFSNPDLQKKRVDTLEIYNKSSFSIKLQEKFYTMSDEQLANMMRAAFSVMNEELKDVK